MIFKYPILQLDRLAINVDENDCHGVNMVPLLSVWLQVKGSLMLTLVVGIDG